MNEQATSAPPRSPSRELRVLVAEPHKLVAQGLEFQLSMARDVELVGVVDTGEQAVERATARPVDVVTLEVNLGRGMSGLDAIRKIKEQSPDTKVLVLTIFTDPGTVSEAIKAGADGYLSKAASREEVLRAIRDVAEGREVLDPHVTPGISGLFSGQDPRELSDEELSVLRRLGLGGSPPKQLLSQRLRAFFMNLLGRSGLDSRIQWNGFRDPRDGMILLLLALIVAVVVVAWSLWRSGLLGS